MVSATPETFLAVLEKVFDDAITAAEGAPGDFNQILDRVVRDAGDDVQRIKKLPQDVYDDLKKLVDPPDWWSLLLFLMVKISDLDPHLSVGTCTPTHWVRMVTLTYAPGAEDAAFTLGLGLVKDPADPGRTRGLLLKAGASPEQGFASGPFSFKVTSTAATAWAIPFGGAPGPWQEDGAPAPPLLASLTLRSSVDLWPEPAGGLPASLVPGGVADLWIGPLVLRATFNVGGGPDVPLYDLKLGLGSGVGPDAGIHAGLATPEPLKGFPLSINIPTVEYTPTASLAKGKPPAFSLHPEGEA